MRSWPARALAAVLFLASVGLGGYALRAALVGTSRARAVEIHGVGLGMSPRDVRERFRAPLGAGGHFRSETRDGDLVLVWSPAPAAADAPRAPSGGEVRDRVTEHAPETRFEFHGGMLVAATVIVTATDPLARGPALDVSSASVLARRGLGDGRAELRLLALDCPTHAAEVRRRLAGR